MCLPINLYLSGRSSRSWSKSRFMSATPTTVNRKLFLDGLKKALRIGVFPEKDRILVLRFLVKRIYIFMSG